MALGRRTVVLRRAVGRKAAGGVGCAGEEVHHLVLTTAQNQLLELEIYKLYYPSWKLARAKLALCD